MQFLIFGLIQAWNDAPTYDEYFHVPMGLTALTRHQLRFTLEHPPLPYVLAAVPALFADPEIPRGPAWDHGDVNRYPAELMAAADRAGKLRELVFLARLVPLLEGAIVGVLLFYLGRRLFGSFAGLIAAGVWLTLPLALGMSHIDGIDIASTLMAVVCALAFLRYVDTPTSANAVVVGVAIGVALLCTFAAFGLVAAAILLIVLSARRGWRLVTKHAALVMLSTWATVWIGYRVISPMPRFRHVDPLPSVKSTLVARLVRIVPWPKEFDVGFYDLGRISKLVAPGYLLGHQWSGRVWWYWPGALLVKLPLTTLIVLVLGAGYAITRRGQWRALLAVALPMVTLTAITVANAEQLGVRYLLPVIALGLTFAGGAVTWVLRWRPGRWFVAVAAAAQLLWFWQSSPNSIAWTAPPFRPAFQYVTDSNVDWGQDLYRLRDWAHGRPMYVAYFGGPGSSAGWRGAQPLVAHSPEAARGLRGTVVVSASNLTSFGRPSFGWLRAYCPIELVGQTLFVYHFQGLTPVSRVPSSPPRICPGETSHPHDG